MNESLCPDFSKANPQLTGFISGDVYDYFKVFIGKCDQQKLDDQGIKKKCATEEEMSYILSIT